MEGWGGHCIVPGSGTAFTVISRTPAPHKCVRAQGSPPDAPAPGAGHPWPNVLIESDNTTTRSTYTETSDLQDPQRQDLLSVQVVDPEMNPG